MSEPTDDEALHDAVAHALGFDHDEFSELVEERPPIDIVDLDDGTAELERRRRLGGNRPMI